jgi:hypothetical protein
MHALAVKYLIIQKICVIKSAEMIITEIGASACMFFHVQGERVWKGIECTKCTVQNLKF